MANIRVNINEPLLNGMDIKFKAPCKCDTITGIKVYYPKADGTTGTQTFTLKDAHGNTLTGISDLFAAGVLIKVMVDTTSGYAYIQNADTNKYLESRMAESAITSGTYTSFDLGAFSSGAVELTFNRLGKFLLCDLYINIRDDNNNNGSIKGKDIITLSGKTYFKDVTYPDGLAMGLLTFSVYNEHALFVMDWEGTTGTSAKPVIKLKPYNADTFGNIYINGYASFIIRIED